MHIALRIRRAGHANAFGINVCVLWYFPVFFFTDL